MMTDSSNSSAEYPEICKAVIANFRSLVYECCLNSTLRQGILDLLNDLIILVGEESVARILMQENIDEGTDSEWSDFEGDFDEETQNICL